VRFVVRLAALLARRYRLDARRTFATGFSNGAFLAYRLACQQSRLFLGIASVAGTQVLRRCRPRQPVSVLHIHGRDDHPTRFEGGILGRPWIPGALEVVARWRTRNGCRAGSTRTLRGAGLLVSRTTGCRQRSEVQLVALEDFGHAWPGAPGSYGAPSAYDATREIGRFFGELRPRPG
jgi:polyhydroxybutyrate depolymerase